jgi:hypothetical protein
MMTATRKNTGNSARRTASALQSRFKRRASERGQPGHVAFLFTCLALILVDVHGIRLLDRVDEGADR